MKKSIRLTLVVLAAAFVIAAAADVVLITCFTDMNTGFLYHGNILLGNLLFFGLSGIACIAAVFASSRDEKKGLLADDFSGSKTAVLGIVTLICATCTVLEGVAEFKAFSPSLLLKLADIIGGALMAVVGFVTLSSKKMKPGIGFSYSLIALYLLGRGIYQAINRMVIVTVPEFLTQILGTAFGAVFFALAAKLLSGNGEKHTKQALCFWGTGAVAMNLSSAAAIIIAKLSAPEFISGRITPDEFTAELYYQRTHGGYMMTFMPYVNIAVGIFAAVFMILLCMGNKKEQPIPAETPSVDNGDNQ